MYGRINEVNLWRCVANNKAAKDFHLGTWVQPCGTYGCLVGNDALAAGCPEVLRNDARIWDWATQAYGLTLREAAFLFSSANICCGGLEWREVRDTVNLDDTAAKAVRDGQVHLLWIDRDGVRGGKPEQHYARHKRHEVRRRRSLRVRSRDSP